MVNATANGQRILVVDDEADILSLCTRALANAGYTVFSASCAAQARRYIDDEQLHLIVLDIHMPDEDGISLLRYVHEVNPTLPTVMITGYPAVNTVLDALRLRARECLCKPFTLQKLLSAVENNLPDGG